MPLCSLSLTPTARDPLVSASGQVRRCGLDGVRRAALRRSMCSMECAQWLHAVRESSIRCGNAVLRDFGEAGVPGGLRTATNNDMGVHE